MVTLELDTLLEDEDDEPLSGGDVDERVESPDDDICTKPWLSKLLLLFVAEQTDELGDTIEGSEMMEEEDDEFGEEDDILFELPAD